MSIATQSDRGPIARLETGHRRPEDPAPLGPKAGSGTPMIAIRGLTKRYGHVAAVQQLSFDVHAGTVVGSSGHAAPVARTSPTRAVATSTMAGPTADQCDNCEDRMAEGMPGRLGDLWNHVDDPAADDQFEALLQNPALKTLFGPRMITNGVSTVRAYVGDMRR